MKTIRVKKLSELARLPAYATERSAAADLCMAEPEQITLVPGETRLVHTGLAMEIPEGYAGFVYARSGLASKRGVAPANKVGVIDSDYRGEILVALRNHGVSPQTLAPGERIAQLVIAEAPQFCFEESASLSDTARGEGGFGSTGKN